MYIQKHISHWFTVLWKPASEQPQPVSYLSGKVFIILEMATIQLICPLLKFWIQLYVASLDIQEIHFSPYTFPLCSVCWPILKRTAPCCSSRVLTRHIKTTAIKRSWHAGIQLWFWFCSSWCCYILSGKWSMNFQLSSLCGFATYLFTCPNTNSAYDRLRNGACM